LKFWHKLTAVGTRNILFQTEFKFQHCQPRVIIKTLSEGFLKTVNKTQLS